MTRESLGLVQGTVDVLILRTLTRAGMHGYAINPARDFGPRLFTAVAGFKNNGLTDGPKVFWVPIVGPILGGIIGSAIPVTEHAGTE